MQYHPDIAGADNDPQKTGWAHRAMVRRQLLIISGEVDVMRPERGLTIRGGDRLIRMALHHLFAKRHCRIHIFIGGSRIHHPDVLKGVCQHCDF